MNQHYADWATPNRSMDWDWDYSLSMWAADVFKAVREGKPVDARIVAKARIIVDGHPHLDGIRSLLRAVNQVAYSQMVAEDKVVEKYTTRYTVIDFRLRPWRENLRVNYAHSLHWQDVQETLGELRKVG